MLERRRPRSQRALPGAKIASHKVSIAFKRSNAGEGARAPFVELSLKSALLTAFFFIFN
jgi:hypothetical protein